MAKTEIDPDNMPVYGDGAYALVEREINSTLAGLWTDFTILPDLTRNGQAAISVNITHSDELPWLMISMEEVFIKHLTINDVGPDTLDAIAKSLAKCAAHVKALAAESKAEDIEPDGPLGPLPDEQTLYWSADERGVVWVEQGSHT